MVDLEYLFLHLRAKSKGELLDAKFSCKAVVSKNEEDTAEAICGNIITLAVRIDELAVKVPEGYMDVIPITEKIGVKMRLPRYKDASTAGALMAAATSNPNNESSESTFNDSLKLVMSCIESVYDDDQVYPVTSDNIKELEVFIESLTTTQYNKIEEYINSMPAIDYTFDVKCSKCGYDHHIAYRDIASFF